MFGQQQNRPAFGGTFGSSTPFGATTTKSSGFGSTGSSTFGTSGGFGSSTPASNSLFGTSNTSTPAAGGLFGGTSTSGGFGQQTQQQSTGFSFGQSNQSQAGTLFGTQNSSLFSTPTTNTFGAKTPGGFGATTQSGGLFGGGSSTSNTSLFGTSNTAQSGGLFASTTGGFNAAQTGTVHKFAAPTGQDTMLKGGISQNINTRHQCITAMKEYENKSLEELRHEDYAANRKGPQAGGSGATMFGTASTQQSTPQTGFGLFGNQANQQNKGFGGFGTTTSTSGGGGGLFGGTQPTQANTGLFGNTSQNKSIFGTATATTSSGFGGFGNPGTTAVFGQSQPQQQPKSTGIFGNTATTNTGGLFANPVPATASFQGFGSLNTTTQAQSGGLFGKPGGFGTQTSAASTGFNFGQTNQQQTTGGLFGQKPAASSTGFSFGTTTGTQQSGGLFGNKPTGFGTGNTVGGFASSTNFGGLGNTSTSGGLFGGQNKPFTGGFALSTGPGTFTGSSNPPTLGTAAPVANTDANAAAQQAQLQQQLLALNAAPYGDSPLFRNLKQNEQKKEELTKPTNPTAQKAALNTSAHYKVNSRPTAKIKPKPLHSIANGKAQLFEGLEEEEASTFGNDTFQPRRSVKKLVIKGDTNRSLNRSQLSGNTSRAESEAGTDEMVAPSPIIDTEKSSQRNGGTGPDSLPHVRTSTEKKSTSDSMPPCPDFSQQKKSPEPLDSTIMELNMRNRLRSALEESRFDSSGEQDNSDNFSESSSPAPHPAGLVLRRPGYYTLPSLDELAECIDDEGSCYVENFVVGREGYGNVMFPGEVNVAGLNLDDIVHFRRKEITIYPDDDTKPPVGKGLNRRAQVTLDCVWPTDKTTHSPIKSTDRLRDMGYQDKLERASARIKAKFIDYRAETGSWVFEVKHFSKYGLVDSDDEEEIDEKDPEKLKLLKEQQKKTLAVQKQKIQLAEQQRLKQQQQLNGFALQSEEGAEQMMEGAQVEQMQVQKQASLSVGLQGMQDSQQRSEAVMMQDDSDMPDIMTEKLPPSPLAMDSASEFGDVEPVPSSHRLAMGLGLQAQELQIRKASFFGDEEDDMEVKSHPYGDKPVHKGLGSLGGFSQSPLQSVLASPARKKDTFSPEKSVWNTSLRHGQRYSPTKPLSPFRSAFVEPTKPGIHKQIPGAQEHMLIPSGMPESEKPRKVVGTRMQRSLTSLKDSVLHEKERCISDMGLYQGRKFRIGWGPHWTLVHNGKPLLHQEEEEDERKGPRFSILPDSLGAPKKKLDTSLFELSIERVHTAPHMMFTDPKTMELLEKTLEIQLENSESSTDENCPLFSPREGVVSLHAYAKEYHQNVESFSSHPDKNYIEQMSVVFDLCVALWGNLPELLIEEDTDRNTYQYHMARREAFSRWLNSVSVPKIEEEMEKARTKGMAEIVSVFSHLTGRQISEACMMAQDVGDHRLALLMAQAVGSDVVRQMLKKQLSTWEETQADQFIDSVYLKVYTLLAGHMVWPASHLRINTCDNLDWKRCLALHLWFHCPPQATISDALRHYDHAYEGGTPLEKYAAAPLPPYLEDTGEPYDEHKIQDMCYHLLKLYSDRTHELHLLLNPSTVTPNSLDYRLSWHLGQILHSLEYQHLSEYHHDSLCCNYAAQLESMGLWHWAVFVLLHIQNNSQREGSVRELLERHIDLDKSEESQIKEKFISERLLVPMEWLHEAKAMKARTDMRPHEEAWHLLKAQKWNDSHRVLLRHVASDAIINEHFDYLKRLLLELGSPDHCSSIQEWAVGGKVFLDYINMIQTIEQLKQGEPSAYELERLQPEVTSLAKRISHLQCNNAKDRLCQSEMAKRVANVMKTLMAMQHPEHDISARLFAPTISQLPMPEDYALQELRQLTRSYMMEVTMS